MTLPRTLSMTLPRTRPGTLPMTRFARRGPFAEFDELIRRSFPANSTDDGSTSASGSSKVTNFRPTVDIRRDGDDALVKLELPGLDFENDITVELDGNQLLIHGERLDGTTEVGDTEGGDTEGGDADESAADDGVRYLREIRYGHFRRAFTLPEHVTADALSASYDAGMLTVRVASAYVGTQPHKIPVTIGVTAGKAATAVDGSVRGDETTDDEA